MRIPNTFKHISRSRRAYLTFGLAVILLLSVNVFSNVVFKSMQLDLTEEQLFTLSEGTKSILGAIDEPITLQLYFTKALGEGNPDHSRYFTRVRELLERYTEVAAGKLRLDLFDAAPFSESEDRAVTYGLTGVPFNEAGDLGYFGIVGTNSTDDIQAIPYFSLERENFLEYDLTKLIHRLANPNKKVIGLISSFSIGGAGTVPNRDAPRWPAIDQIREFFDVQALPVYVDKIPDEIDALVIIHPRGIDPYALYAIDQFVLRGGRVLLFVDSLFESGPKLGPGFTGAGRSQFDRLLNGWGVSLVPHAVAGDMGTARRVRIRHEGRIAVVDYVAWLTLSSANFDTQDVVTSDIKTINVGTAGILEPLGTKGITVTPLISTSPRAMPVEARRLSANANLVELFRTFKPQNKPLMLASRSTGQIKTVFPKGPPAAKEKSKDGADTATTREHLTESKSPINVIVVADVDMLHDEFWADIREDQGRNTLVPNANNVDFVINALDNLTGSDALIGLRGRANSTRPFFYIQDLRREAERKFRQKERQLQQRLAQVRGEMETLAEQKLSEGKVGTSEAEKTKINEVRREMVSVRKELRQDQRALRRDLDHLDGLVKFLNIAAIPLILVIGVIAAASYRRRRVRQPQRV